MNTAKNLKSQHKLFSAIGCNKKREYRIWALKLIILNGEGCDIRSYLFFNETNVDKTCVVLIYVVQEVRKLSRVLLIAFNWCLKHAVKNNNAICGTLEYTLEGFIVAATLEPSSLFPIWGNCYQTDMSTNVNTNFMN